MTRQKTNNRVVELTMPPQDTVLVISEAVFTANYSNNTKLKSTGNVQLNKPK